VVWIDQPHSATATRASNQHLAAVVVAAVQTGCSIALPDHAYLLKDVAHVRRGNPQQAIVHQLTGFKDPKS
jgi:hypothetical protein